MTKFPFEWLAFNNPLSTDDPVINTISFIHVEDAIKFMAKRYEHLTKVSDDELLEDFMVVNWAWPVKEPDCQILKL